MPDPLVEADAYTTAPSRSEDPAIPEEVKFAWILFFVVIFVAGYFVTDRLRRSVRRSREGELSRNTGWEEPPPPDDPFDRPD